MTGIYDSQCLRLDMNMTYILDKVLEQSLWIMHLLPWLCHIMCYCIVLAFEIILNVLCWLTWVLQAGRQAWFLVYFACLLDRSHTILLQPANIFLRASPQETRSFDTLRQLLTHMWASPTPKTSSTLWKSITGRETHLTLNWMIKSSEEK